MTTNYVVAMDAVILSRLVYTENTENLLLRDISLFPLLCR